MGGRYRPDRCSTMPGGGSPPASWRSGHARVAGRLAAAGLEPGDRMVTSAETSAELVVTHVAALRLGLVVVPVNGAYREREIAHIVRDARPSAALVDDRERGEWITRAAAPARVLVVAPDVELTDGQPPALDACALRRRRDALLHVGNHRHAQGRAPHPPQRAREPGGAAVGVAVGARRSSRARASAVPHARARCGLARHAALRARRWCCSRRFDPGAVLDAAQAEQATLFFGVPTMYDRLARSGACPRAERVAPLRFGLGTAARRPPPAHRERGRRHGARALRAHRDADELLESVRRRASRRHGGLRAPRRRDPPR